MVLVDVVGKPYFCGNWESKINVLLFKKVCYLAYEMRFYTIAVLIPTL